MAREVIAMIVNKVRAGVGRWAGGERERYTTRESSREILAVVGSFGGGRDVRSVGGSVRDTR